LGSHAHDDITADNFDGRRATIGVALRWSVVPALLPMGLLAVLVALDAPRETAGQGPALIAAGHFDAVAATASGVVAIAGDTVHVFDPSGISRRSIALTREAPSRSRRRRAADGFAPVAGLTADGDFGDPVDEDELDDADDPRVDDETAPRAWDLEDGEPRLRSSATSMSAPAAAVVVAAGNWAWIHRADELWRVDLQDGSATRAPISGAAAHEDEVGALAVGGPGGRIVAVLEQRRLLLSVDGGETFEPIAVVDTPLGALSVTPSGAIYGIDDRGLGRYGAGEPSEGTRVDRVLARAGAGMATDVVSCGREVIWLRGDGLSALVGEETSPRIEKLGAAPEGTRGLACDGSLWVTFGIGLWTSGDRGRSWSPRPDLPPGTIAAVGASGSAIWVAASSGLWRLPRAAPASPPAWRFAAPGASPTRALGARSGVTWRGLAAALPRLDLSLTVAQTAARRDIRALVVLTFALEGRRWARAGEQASRDLLRQATSSGVGATVIPSSSSAAAARDPIAAEEQRELARVLEDQP
jgi:hypothetical protein